MLKNIIFDLDGVIVDSEPVHFKAHKKSIEKFGIQLSKGDYLKYGVARGDEFLFASMSKKFGKKINLEKARMFKRKYFEELLQKELRLREGIDVLLSFLKDRYSLAVASSSRGETIEAVLEKFEIFQYFEVVVGGDDVENVKPAPDIYLKVVAELNAAAGECIAIEDSETGLLAAKAAGLKCIAVPTEFTGMHDFSQADFLVEDLLAIKKVITEL
jgi:HAD superfamily hydrolase (TIGR01509 family)